MSEMMNDQFFKLYAHCILVKGASRSVICDLKKKPGYHLIPDSLYEVLHTCKSRSYADMLGNYGDEERPILDSYFNYLITNDLGFWCETDELNYFADLPLEWDFPGQISNAIIDAAQYSDHPYEKIFKELVELQCCNVQLRFYDTITVDKLNDILSCLSGKPLFYIEILLKYDEHTDNASWIDLLSEFPSVWKLIFHSANKESIMTVDSDPFNTIFFIQQKILSQSHCGFIHRNYFDSNIQLFSEAQNYNTCLNRKIAVDVDGNIKNCPSMESSFGNIHSNSLGEALLHRSFTDLWYIRKDEVQVCKDCEFRYICTDCRAFLQTPTDQYSKPLKCGYDPYTAKWENWAENELSKNAMHYYYLKQED